MVAAFTTIGHSNRSLEEFFDILRDAGVRVLVDVRSFPRSRSNPVFNTDRLNQSLARERIDYRHFPDLGGRRNRQKDVDAEVNALWRVQSFHNYADYALGDAFAQALDEVERIGAEARLAMMCAEAVWWRCHRRIITDHLLARGHAVDHLMGAGRIEPAHMFPGAVPMPDGKVTYPTS